MADHHIPACNIRSNHNKQENCKEEYSAEALVNCVIYVLVWDYGNFISDVPTRGGLMEEEIYYNRLFVKDNKFISSAKTNVAIYLGTVKYKTKRNGDKEIRVSKKVADDLDRLGCEKLLLSVNGRVMDGKYRNQTIIISCEDAIMEVLITGAIQNL